MCDTPVKLRKGDVVPCGRCSDCINAHRNSWIQRLYFHANTVQHAYFVTLTYADEYLSYCDTDVPVLNYRDIQLFFKRCRKAGFRFKYFGCGEYGEHFSRPHYHVLFFSDQPDFNVQRMVDENWYQGFNTIQWVSEANIRYTTKDMLKETSLFEGAPRSLKPHIFCSKGIGLEYVKQMAAYYRKQPFELPFIAFDGSARVMPRYFKEKIYTKHERNIHRRRLENSRRHNSVIPQNASGEVLEALHHESRISTQKIEQKKQKRLKINHYNKKL